MNTEKEHCFMILKQGGMIYVFDLESFYGGLHCGECFDVKVKDIWIPVRIEMGDDWYLVGLNVSRLDGLRVRM